MGRGRREDGLPSTALLNLGNVELQQTVEPLHEFLSVVSVSVAVVAWEQMGVRGIYRDSPILNEGCCVCVCGRVRIGERKAGDRKRTMHCACVV